MTAPVPYQFANTPNGATIPLNQLDANFQYLVNEIGGPLSVSPNELTALGPNWDGTGKLSSQGDLYTGSGRIGTLTSNLPLLQLNNLGFTFTVNTNSSLLVQSNGIQVDNAIRLTQDIGGILTLSPPNASINTQFTFPPDMGQQGYVLSTNGSGTTNWVAPFAAAVTSFSAGTTGLLPETATTGNVVLSGILGVDNGGTGIGTIPTSGQILIGNGTGYTITQLTAGNGISIVNGAGTITIGLAANIGVTSISGGTTGLTFGTGTGAITVAGRVNISAGGTNAVTAQDAINNLVSNVTTNGYVLQGNGTNVTMSPLTSTTIAGAGVLTNTISTATYESAAINTPPIFADSGGTPMGVLCRAWVSFTTAGTTVIQAGFNVSSVTYLSPGQYRVNFTRAFSDANYCVQGTASGNAGSGYMVCVNNNLVANNQVNIQCLANGGTYADPTAVYIAVFR